VYRSRFGLPPCTTANTCFKAVSQTGGSVSGVRGDVGWGQEIDLDIEMASAICPQCNILLVEANSNSFGDLGAAVNWAASSSGGKANAVSNSYGTSGEFSSEPSYDTAYYNHPGVAITASSGDSGYGVEYPAASPDVVAVGGTSLYEDNGSVGSALRSLGGHTWTESAWSGAGSGCSAVEGKPSWQTDATTCSNRTVADVSAVADPNTGVAVYDSYGSSGGANWYVFGGTSVASPIIGSVYALARANWTGYSYPAQFTYGHTTSLFDVTTGSNGRCTSTTGNPRKRGGSPYLCTAGTGFDGPTGLGTPNGTGAF